MEVFSVNEIKRFTPETIKQPIKAYSNGVLIPLGTANLLFTAGQLSQDKDSNIIAPNDPVEQTKYILEHIGDILKDADMTYDDVVKLQIFTTNIDYAPQISAVRDSYFSNSRPASIMIEVSRFLKPEYCVEIDATAVKLLN
jgi:enamine deaminase RidA (YjgF/YER057c/UK114 family)